MRVFLFIQSACFTEAEILLRCVRSSFPLLVPRKFPPFFPTVPFPEVSATLRKKHELQDRWFLPGQNVLAELLARNLDKRSTNFLYYLRAWKKWEKVSDIKLRGAVCRGGNLDL